MEWNSKQSLCPWACLHFIYCLYNFGKVLMLGESLCGSGSGFNDLPKATQLKYTFQSLVGIYHNFLLSISWGYIWFKVKSFPIRAWIRYSVPHSSLSCHISKKNYITFLVWNISPCTSACSCVGVGGSLVAVGAGGCRWVLAYPKERGRTVTFSW